MFDPNSRPDANNERPYFPSDGARDGNSGLQPSQYNGGASYPVGQEVNRGGVYHAQTDPTTPTPSVSPSWQAPSTNRPPARSSAVSRAVLTTLLLATLFGGLLFGAGWLFGRGSVNNNNAAQTGTTGSTQSPSSLDALRTSVVSKVRPEVVQINVATAQGGGLGSGVIIDKAGYIVTNNHVVQGAQAMEVVLYGGEKVRGQITGTDPADDLAVVKITPPAKMAVATLGDSSKLQVGQEVLAVGNPLGITQTVTNGIVSALNRTVSEGQGGATLPNAIQTDAPINPGNSGGALVDLQGHLIGIPTLTAIDPEFNAPANGVGFAIPSNRVKFIVPQIINSGHVTNSGRAAMGVSVQDVDSTVASQQNLSVDYGALIVNVQSGGPAARAGLRPGDVIVQVGDAQIVDSTTLGDALANSQPGSRVPVKYYRASQTQTVTVTLGELQISS